MGSSGRSAASQPFWSPGVTFSFQEWGCLVGPEPQLSGREHPHMCLPLHTSTPSTHGHAYTCTHASIHRRALCPLHPGKQRAGERTGLCPSRLASAPPVSFRKEGGPVGHAPTAAFLHLFPHPPLPSGSTGWVLPLSPLRGLVLLSFMGTPWLGPPSLQTVQLVPGPTHAGLAFPAS